MQALIVEAYLKMNYSVTAPAYFSHSSYSHYAFSLPCSTFILRPADCAYEHSNGQHCCHLASDVQWSDECNTTLKVFMESVDDEILPKEHLFSRMINKTWQGPVYSARFWSTESEAAEGVISIDVHFPHNTGSSEFWLPEGRMRDRPKRCWKKG